MNKKLSILRIIEDLMDIIDHIVNHSNLFHKVLNQTSGERQEQTSQGIDQMRDHSLLEGGDSNQTRGIEITLTIEIEVFQELPINKNILHPEHDMQAHNHVE